MGADYNYFIGQKRLIISDKLLYLKYLEVGKHVEGKTAKSATAVLKSLFARHGISTHHCTTYPLIVRYLNSLLRSGFQNNHIKFTVPIHKHSCVL